MIVELAEYERDPGAVKASEDDLFEALFGTRPVAEAVIAEVSDEEHASRAQRIASSDAPELDPSSPWVLAGHAVFYETFSTWEGKAGIWLEDLYVRPPFRGTGTGAALLGHLAELTLSRGFTRCEWVALDWNDLALDFYERFGASRYDEWKLHRLSGEALRAAAVPPAG
jgi:GNAT superfamily N-acetyltransferase